MKTSGTDTLAAIATPLGEGGISVIRVSGRKALGIASSVFKGKSDLQKATSHTAHFGVVQNPDGNIIDEVVATVFIGPHSYTGEDVVEISCHGGILVTRRVLEELLHAGARLAEPGEFTKRAFLNGRIDLSQAEAVADLIHARSTTAHQASILQLEGALSERIRSLRTSLIDSIGLLELELDFVEEDLEFVNKKQLATSISDTRDETNRLLGTFKLGRIYREGVKVAIVGPPNAGKSSLLNALLESNRAIVTDIPGTTRDTIEESVVLGGLSFRLVDTAGLRDTPDVVEKEGIRRTESEARTSDIILVVLDGSEKADVSHDQVVADFWRDRARFAGIVLPVINKSDLPQWSEEGVRKRFGIAGDIGFVRVSAVTRMGLDDLQSRLVDLALCDKMRGNESSATVTSARHYDALRRAASGLGLAIESLEKGASNEFVTIDLRNALDSLGEITGEVTTDEILESIFSKFCIGK